MSDTYIPGYDIPQWKWLFGSRKRKAGPWKDEGPPPRRPYSGDGFTDATEMGKNTARYPDPLPDPRPSKRRRVSRGRRSDFYDMVIRRDSRPAYLKKAAARRSKRYVNRPRMRQLRPLYVVPRGIPVGPAPPHKVCKLSLTYDRTHSFQASEYAYTKVRGNSHYQPIQVASNVGGAQDAGAASAQPYGWSEWENFYDQYRITGATIEVTSYIMGGADSEFPVVMSLWAQDDAETISTSIEQQKEGLRAKQLILTTQGGAAHPKKMRLSKATRSVLGPVGKSNTVNTTGNTDGPTDMWDFIVFYDTMADQTRGVTDVKIFQRIHVVYTVHFFDRKTLSQSTQ